MFCGCAGFIYSLSSIRSFERGDVHDAKRSSKKAFRCNLIWTVCFFAMLIFGVIFIGISLGLKSESKSLTTTTPSTTI